MVITYTIKKTVGENEYVVRFHVNGRFIESWTAYESDKAAAIETAKATVEHMRQNPQCL